MASGATRRRRLPPGVDYTRALSVELLASALDYLDQPDVLRTARVSKWLVRADNNATDYVSDSSWTGNKKFHDQLDDAAKGDGAITSYRVVVHFRLHYNGYGRENSVDKLRALIKILTARTVPRLHALFPRIKALRLVFPDDLRPVAFDILRHPAPVLESLCLEFTDPQWYNSDDEDNSYPDSEGEDADGTEAPNVESDLKSVVPAAAGVHSERFLPSDLFGGQAPRLQSIDMSGVRLGGKPISVLSRVRNAHINLDVPLHSLGRSPAEHLPALSRLILGVSEESIPESGLPKSSLALPATLSSFCIRAFDDSYVEDILEDTGITSSTDRIVPTVEVELMGDNNRYTSRQYDWATLLNELDAAHSMRIEYYPPNTHRHFFSITPDLSLSVESPNGIVRTVHWTDSDFCTREDDHDEEHYFTQFKDFSRLRCSSLQLITVAHPYLPALFALKELPSLRRLEIDMDEFEAPFWKTQATDESDDYAGGDHTPPRRPTPPPRRPPRPPRPSPPRRKGRNRRGGRGQWYDEDVDEDWYDPDDPWREDDMDGIPRWYSNWESSSAECGLLNTFDEEDEEHTLQCPALETVVLRTSYSHTNVHMRQLAHFGRALGLLDREEGGRPRLVLLGVELSYTRYGTLHLKVFEEVEQVPLPAVRYRKDDHAGNYDPETDYEDYVSDDEAEV
ncbi:hypothetical protein EXIGLDRAFT_844643 [Exidia glandulosa HHB12029]|uniref:Uncharacterized protein n=1 Tax=Exidia glandulosa HHB12029 TaxID=1314781 RepID=A0A165BX07_EXIGL|nr:hypothetical protein EXIGLDRAFT_844643 [Exidia glandulosa HHB12029]